MGAYLHKKVKQLDFNSLNPTFSLFLWVKCEVGGVQTLNKDKSFKIH